MFGLGRKDKDGKQIRIEHRGKYTRASRTGGVALRAEKKLGPVNATANTSDGIRLSSRVRCEFPNSIAASIGPCVKFDQLKSFH